MEFTETSYTRTRKGENDSSYVGLAFIIISLYLKIARTKPAVSISINRN